MNYTTITLGELLTHTNETIKRNAMSILKVLQKQKWCLNCDTVASESCKKYHLTN